MALAYTDRIRGERADNLERAIDAVTQALQVRTCDAHPADWAATQNNLANAYLHRIRGERADNLERAIMSYKKALHVYTRDAFPEQWAATQNNLALAYFYRIRGKKAENLGRSIEAYQLALQARTPDAFPKDCRDTAQNLAFLHFQERNWAAAAPAYTLALTATETLYQSSISLNGKVDELKATGIIPHGLAYAQTQLGHLQSAVLTLEQGRARGLSKSLDRDRADLAQLQTLAPSLYTKYQDITQQLRNLESRDRERIVSTERDRVPEDLLNTTTKLRKTLENMINQIRQVPSYEDFLSPTKWEDIQKAVTVDCPLVYLVTTPNGGMALIVTVDEVGVLWLNDLKEETLREILYGPADEEELSHWRGTYRDFRNDSKENYPAWCQEIDTTTRQLWDLLMSPLVQKLQEIGCDHIALIPTGFLSLLPLHAAWIDDESKPTKRRCAFDDIHITYTPNAKSLTAAQIVADRVQADSILVIDDPRQDLLHSEREVQAAIDYFLPQATILRHDRATTAAVKTALPQAAIAHFSCHGTANLNDPLTSGLERRSSHSQRHLRPEFS